MGQPSEPIARMIDAMLASEKTLVGRPEWRSGTRSGELRAFFSMLSEGEGIGWTFEIKAYPSQRLEGFGGCRFKLMLLAPRRIWGIDFEYRETPHFNPMDRAPLLDGEHIIRGPHYHAWADNRHLAKQSALPDRLRCARSLPPQIRRWEQAFRWFCDQTNTIFEPDQLIPLPERTELF